MKYIVQAQSPIALAVRHVLTNILAIPASSVTDGIEFGVNTGKSTFNGLLPVLRALRSSSAASTMEGAAFLGMESAEHTPLVNQWVSAASLLSADAVRCAATGEHVSVASAIYADIERALEASMLRDAFLAGTPRATIADVLLYAALHGHPAHAEVRPTTMQWSLCAQQDAFLTAVRFSHVVAASKPGAKESSAAGGAEKSSAPTYVKPTEEEIVRRRLEKEKAKKEKEAAKAATAAPAAASVAKVSKKVEEVDHQHLEIRVGKLSNLRRHPEADRLYVEDMDMGPNAAARTIVSGLVEYYTPEQLNDTLCLVVCNMKPKPLKGVTSEGMVLCASNDHGLSIVRPPAGAQPGDRVVFGAAFNAEEASAPSPGLLSGNKMTDLLSHLHTNAACALCWKGMTAHTSAGSIAVLDMPDCVVK